MNSDYYNKNKYGEITPYNIDGIILKYMFHNDRFTINTNVLFNELGEHIIINRDRTLIINNIKYNENWNYSIFNQSISDIIVENNYNILIKFKVCVLDTLNTMIFYNQPVRFFFSTTANVTKFINTFIQNSKYVLEPTNSIKIFNSYEKDRIKINYNWNNTMIYIKKIKDIQYISENVQRLVINENCDFLMDCIKNMKLTELHFKTCGYNFKKTIENILSCTSLRKLSIFLDDDQFYGKHFYEEIIQNTTITDLTLNGFNEILNPFDVMNDAFIKNTTLKKLQLDYDNSYWKFTKNQIFETMFRMPPDIVIEMSLCLEIDMDTLEKLCDYLEKNNIKLKITLIITLCDDMESRFFTLMDKYLKNTNICNLLLESRGFLENEFFIKKIKGHRQFLKNNSTLCDILYNYSFNFCQK